MDNTDEYKKLTVKNLQKILKLHSLPVHGNKSDLVKLIYFLLIDKTIN